MQRLPLSGVPSQELHLQKLHDQRCPTLPHICVRGLLWPGPPQKLEKSDIPREVPSAWAVARPPVTFVSRMHPASSELEK